MQQNDHCLLTHSGLFGWIANGFVDKRITNGPPAPAAFAASDPTGHELAGLGQQK